MSGPYGPNDAPAPGGDRSSEPTEQWTGQPAAQPAAAPQWAAPQPGQPQWGQSQTGWPQQPATPQQPAAGQPQWAQQSQPSWPQAAPAQPAQPGWESTQQQWSGQPQWAQQPTAAGQQWGQPPAQAAGQTSWDQNPLTVTPAKNRKPLIFGGVVAAVVVVVLAVLGFVFFGSDKLDDHAVAQGVQKVLKDSYGIDDVQSVSCPSGQKVTVGNTFTCSLKVGGEQKTVTIKVTKDDGTYEVGRPN
ncbi:DUF4333 domain-containing protein [Nocardia stercoris]|uniref:DUF4333 domain-containing protein n=1 Tax=Nocardia stercoris TaxID=2483361 RepID=A0A3M2L4L4_9NOCA|nr:DUF4333 domain-containing protein [Nocardia stercoris]RMI32314.1 DUF4333 domain-containing protein [Nocardia stercoris]